MMIKEQYYGLPNLPHKYGKAGEGILRQVYLLTSCA